jgi:hypothetical protein
MSLVLPDWVAENYRRQEMVESHLGAAKWLAEALKGIDPELSVVWAKEGADDDRLVPGRWHVRRDNSRHGLPDTYMAITAPDGGYREPDAGVLDELAQRDMRRAGNGPDAQVRAREAREAKLRARAAERAGEAREDTYYLAKSELAPGVLVSDDVPWSARARGRR